MAEQEQQRKHAEAQAAVDSLQEVTDATDEELIASWADDGQALASAKSAATESLQLLESDQLDEEALQRIAKRINEARGEED